MTESPIGRSLVIAAAAAAFWFVFIWSGAFGAMFWFILPLALVCLVYVTAMLYFVELSAFARLGVTLVAPAPALLMAYFRIREEDTLSQAAIILTGEFIALLAALGSIPSALNLIKSNNALKGQRAKRARP